MTISLEIPKEFEEHFSMDRFEDSLERIRVEIGLSDNIMAGLYELELIKMLKDSLIKSEIIKE